MRLKLKRKNDIYEYIYNKYKMYFYIQDNKDWNSDKKVKYGIADEYKSRLKTDQHSYKSEYISLFEVVK